LIDVAAPNIAYISQTKLQLLSRREPPVDLKQDPVLTIWEARNLLAEIAVFPETDEISKMVAETERDLVNLILRILAHARCGISPGSGWSRDQTTWNLEQLSNPLSGNRMHGLIPGAHRPRRGRIPSPSSTSRRSVPAWPGSSRLCSRRMNYRSRRA
jgi:hypothetical protein